MTVLLLAGWVNLHVVPAGKRSNTSDMDKFGVGKDPKNPHVSKCRATHFLATFRSLAGLPT